jgi:polyhydroxyalkanoate synthesis regulator phasin
MALSFGGSIAKYDMEITKILQETADNEKNNITNYIALKEFTQQGGKKYNKELLQILESRNLELKYKLENKERQNEALLIILEYLNTLEKNKYCRLNIQETVNKIVFLENEIKMLRNII